MNNPKGLQSTKTQPTKAELWKQPKVIGLEQAAPMQPISSGTTQVSHQGYRRYPDPFSVAQNVPSYSAEINELRF